jgi:hypothetical protein
MEAAEGLNGCSKVVTAEAGVQVWDAEPTRVDRPRFVVDGAGAEGPAEAAER